MGLQCSATSKPTQVDYLYEGVSWQVRSRNSLACGYSFKQGQLRSKSQYIQSSPALKSSNYNQREYSQFKRVPYVNTVDIVHQQQYSAPAYTGMNAAKADLKSSTLDTEDTVPRARLGHQTPQTGSWPVIPPNQNEQQQVDSVPEIPKLRFQEAHKMGTAVESQYISQEKRQYQYSEFAPYPETSLQNQQQTNERPYQVRKFQKEFNQFGSYQPHMQPENYQFQMLTRQAHSVQQLQQQPQSELRHNDNYNHNIPQPLPVTITSRYVEQNKISSNAQLPASKASETVHNKHSTSSRIPSSVRSDKSSQLQVKLREAEHHYKQHNIDMAYEKSQQIHKRFPAEINGLSGYYKHMLREIDLEYQDVINYAAEIYKNKWVLKTDEKGRKLSTCQTKNTIAVLVQGELHYPMELFLSIINELNLHKKFIPFLILSQQEKRLGRNSKIGHCVSDFPIISKRQVFFQGAGFNRLDTNNNIFMYTRSIHNRPDLLKRFEYQPVPTPGTVMLEYKYISLECTPYNSHHGFVKLCINADMRLDYIPKFMLEAATKTFGLEFFDNVVKICQNFKGSEWQKAIMKEPELFQFYKKSIRSYLHKKGIRQ